MYQRESWRQLAVFGRTPLFSDPLHVNKPNTVNRARLFSRIDDMLSRRWFSDGQLVKEFEENICRLAGVRHCVATCNGTLALEIAFRALNLTGEVIVPSFTFAATAQALRWLNLTPVFADVDPRTHNLDACHVEHLITLRTSAIVGVYLWGQPCDIDALSSLARRKQLVLLFDAAQALGSSYRGKPIGGFGSAEIFSFHATKFVNSAEGGAITTDDDILADKLRALRDFGFNSDDQIVDVGTNGKMSEICVAMGLTSVESFDEIVAANYKTYLQYKTELADIPGISLLPLETEDNNNYQYIVTLVDESVTQISRDDLLKVLRAENILAKRYFYPGCHQMTPNASGMPDRHDLPVTESLIRTVLVLPGGASIDVKEVTGVCETLRLAAKHGAELREALIGK
jgi:dTDP-4-amino-4,6-dideoxygalactose transaminase